MTSRDLGKPRRCMSLYRAVLYEGPSRYLDQDLLLPMWPVPRTLLGRIVRTVGEHTSAACRG